MRVTKELIESHNACSEGHAWFVNAFPTGGEHPDVMARIMADDHWNWLRWLVVRLMTIRQRREWAIYCAEQVIDIYERKYPHDARPRKAIEAAKAVLASDTPENLTAANADYAAFYAAFYATTVADAATAHKTEMCHALTAQAIAIISRSETDR